MTKVLVVDDKQLMRDSVGATLQRAGFLVVASADGDNALQMVGRHRPAAVITDLKMPAMDGLELMQRIRQADDQLPVVLMTAYGSIDSAVQAMKSGAFDFIQKPFEGDQLVMTIRRAVEHYQLLNENTALCVNAQTYDDAPVLVGRSDVMRRLEQQIHQIAHSQGTVLITGESGTGKEVVARTIRAHSRRRDRVMLCLNCAALSSSLLESELFGHEKGAFTGADQLRKGRFELADGGTLLLDEISEIAPALQAKLLRVLQERQFERVGASLTRQVDARVIATTNRDLERCVAEGLFRTDLYYRLNVLPIHLPPLRYRLDDLSLLAEHFLIQVAMREGNEAKKFDDEAIKLMQEYSWPGNVRELQNICERASVLNRGRVIRHSVIQPWLTAPPSQATGHAMLPTTHHTTLGHDAPGILPGATPGVVPGDILGGGSIKKLEDFEREQIIHTLGRFNGNRQRTAEALGIGVRTLGLKLKKWKEHNLVAQSL